MLTPTEGKGKPSTFFHIRSVLDDHKQEIIPTMEKGIPGLAVARASTSEDLKILKLKKMIVRNSRRISIQSTSLTMACHGADYFNPGAGSSLVGFYKICHKSAQN